MNLKNVIVADSSPYPEIKVQAENEKLARQISSAFGGNGGEFGTISEYVYQSIVFPEYSELFRRLAIVEMKHLNMIGQLMEQLGGRVIYGYYPDKEAVYWNGVGVNYTRDITTALLYDLNGEQRAYSSYVTLARQSGDRYVFAILTRIALDEMIHTSLLKSLLASL